MRVTLDRDNGHPVFAEHGRRDIQEAGLATLDYPLLVKRSPNGFNASFPDLPGYTGKGNTVMEAVRNATDALAGHLRILCAAPRRP